MEDYKVGDIVYGYYGEGIVSSLGMAHTLRYDTEDGKGFLAYKSDVSHTLEGYKKKAIKT